MREFSYFFFVFLGNQPLSTRFFCAKSSPMPHSAEKAKIPRKMERYTFSTNNEAPADISPTHKKAHHERTPK